LAPTTGLDASRESVVAEEKPSLVGGTGGGTVSVLICDGDENSSRSGVPFFRSATRRGVAWVTMWAATWAGVQFGSWERRTAAAPATWGDAMEVPDKIAAAVFEVCHAAVIALPGANRSRHEPWLEYDARASVLVVAPTVIASGTREGE
jgi:hypothetical protein